MGNRARRVPCPGVTHMSIWPLQSYHRQILGTLPLFLHKLPFKFNKARLNRVTGKTCVAMVSFISHYSPASGKGVILWRKISVTTLLTLPTALPLLKFTAHAVGDSLLLLHCLCVRGRLMWPSNSKSPEEQEHSKAGRNNKSHKPRY